jgi:hypothetical protein
MVLRYVKRGRNSMPQYQDTDGKWKDLFIKDKAPKRKSLKN